jgi:hypothetical protein
MTYLVTIRAESCRFARARMFAVKILWHDRCIELRLKAQARIGRNIKFVAYPEYRRLIPNPRVQGRFFKVLQVRAD